MNKYYETNRSLWNAKTAVHEKSDFYDMEAFRAGKSSLKATETEELGTVAGKTMLHLQCHFGQDSLSWAQKGAKVTGIDFAEEAIDLAKQLNEEMNLDAQFICSNVYDLPNVLDEQFDIVFTSYGVLCWLADIEGWATIVNKYLKKGGCFYIVEFHPSLMMFEFDSGEMRLDYPYFLNEEPMEEEMVGTYADPDAPLRHKEYFWNHPLGAVVTALIKQGLSIEFVHEFPYSHWGCYPNMVEIETDKWQMQGFEGLVPMMYSIKAYK